MLFFIFAISLAQTLLNVVAVIQFLSMLLLRETNEMLRQFGTSIGLWLRQTAAFQSGETEEKPFPWSPWPTKDKE
ncbi:DUF4389 domain-containing protein [Rhodobacteraceae bacterium NNCM2]|nr:DUF4389 domain-containing protein [Coraliihabitans acroporae]